MNTFKKSLLWLCMLNKRLYKKPSFIAILVGIVILSLGLSFFAGGEDAVLRIAVCSDGGDVSEFVESLKSEESIIQYELFPSRNDALHALQYKGYDSVWVLPDDISESAKRYAGGKGRIAEVIQRDDSVFLRLAREKLYASLYPYIAKAVYNDFISDSFVSADDKSMDEFYDSRDKRGEIVNINFLNSSDTPSDTNLLFAPLRGMLAVAVFLCAYSALMNFKKDRISGMYARVREERHIYLEMIGIFLASANSALVSLIAFAFCGVFTSLASEILAMILYLLMCVMFCALLGELVHSVNVLGAIMPVVIIMMLAICPIFFNMSSMSVLQLALPPYYYLMMFAGSKFFAYSAVYITAASILIFLLRRFKSAFSKL